MAEGRSVDAALVSLVSLVSVAATSCAGAAASSSHIEDRARRDVPIAICRRALSANDLEVTGAPRPEVYWKAVIPGFAAFDIPMAPPAVDCVGDPIVGQSHAQDRGSASASVSASATAWAVSAAVDGMQSVWLRVSAVSDRVASGPLALLRPRPAELDVYAIGSYRGSSHSSRFQIARIGRVVAVTADDDACADVKVETECESTTTFYLAVGGELVAAATTPSRRTRYGTLKAVGRVRFRLTTDPPVFDDHSVHVREKLSVRDSSDDEVRKSEGERVFTLDGGALVANEESIASQSIDRP
jgi:hypothetical protein